jgi:hypothetical protein
MRNQTDVFLHYSEVLRLMRLASEQKDMRVATSGCFISRQERHKLSFQSLLCNYGLVS